MTAKFLHSFPARNTLRVVNQNLKMTIVTGILYILGIPLGMGAFMLEMIFESRDTPYSIMIAPYFLIASTCLTGAVFMGLIAAINSFTELHNKTKVDMLYSLPLTGRQRFFSDYIGGICMYILPYVLSVILGWIVIGVMYPFIDRESADMVMEEGTLLGEISKYYALLSFGLLALMLLYYALSVFVTVCCGTLFESIYTNLLLNLLIPGTIAAVTGVISANVELDFSYMWQIIGFISPIGGLIYMFYIILDFPLEFYSSNYAISATQTTQHEMLPSYLRWIAVIVAVAVLLTIAAWQLYVRRKAEHVGKPFVYLAAYYVMLTLGTCLILCLMETGVVGAAILFAAIVYFVMEVIRKRGFRRFWVSLITFAVTVGAAVGMYLLIVNTGCFGRVNYVPASAAVNSVRVKMDLSDYWYYHNELVLEYTDRDVISAVTAAHKEIVNARKKGNDPVKDINQKLSDERMYNMTWNESDYTLYAPDLTLMIDDCDEYWDTYDYYDQSPSEYEKALGEGQIGDYCETIGVQIDYYTLTGSVIHRSYDVTLDEYVSLLLAVQGTELSAQAYGDALKSRITDAVEVYSDVTHTYKIPEKADLTIKSDYANDKTIQITNVQNFIDKLTETYVKELSAMTAEQLLKEKVACRIESIPVYETCTETLTLLKTYGFEEYSLMDRYGLNSTGTSAAAIRIYQPGTYSVPSMAYPCSTSTLATTYVKNVEPAYEDVCPYPASILYSYPEMTELMKAARTDYITADDCYLLVVNGNYFTIPAEDSDLAEAVIAKGSGYLMSDAFEPDMGAYSDGTESPYGFWDYNSDWYGSVGSEA